MTDTERIDFLLGQVAALKAFAMASVLSHPNPNLFARAFHALAERTDAQMLPTPASAVMLDGIAEIREAIERAVSGAGQPPDGR